MHDPQQPLIRLTDCCSATSAHHQSANPSHSVKLTHYAYRSLAIRIPAGVETRHGRVASAGQKPPGEGGGHFSGVVAMAVADNDVDEADAPSESQTTGLVSGTEKVRRLEDRHSLHWV